MKRLLLILALSIPCCGQILEPIFGTSSSSIPLSVVECQHGTLPNTSSGTVTLTFGTSTTAGEAIFAGAISSTSGNTFPASPITDTGSSTYTAVYNNVGTGGGSLQPGYFAYALNVASGITSVTVKESSSAGPGGAWACHIKGVKTASALDTNTPSFSGPTTSPWSSASINTAIAKEIVFGIMHGVFNGSNCNPTLAGGWTSGGIFTSSAGYDGSNGGAAALGYQIFSSTQTGLQFTGTDSGTCNHYTAAVALEGQ